MSPNFLFLCAETAASGDLGIDWSVLGGVLALVAALMVVIRFVGILAANSQPEDEKKKVLSSPTTVASAAASDKAISPELVAVLTAAASTALGSAVRLLGVTEVVAEGLYAQRAWAQEGRREIYMSHRIR